MSHITLVLSSPVSANRHWRPTIVGKRVMFTPTKESKAYKKEVAAVCLAAGIRKPITGRVLVEVFLFPHRPQDWQKRMRDMGANWDDSVRSIDLDNANKVILDSLKGIAIEDDKWVRELVAIRMEPDEHGARAVVRITALSVDTPQLPIDLPPEAAAPLPQEPDDEPAF